MGRALAQGVGKPFGPSKLSPQQKLSLLAAQASQLHQPQHVLNTSAQPPHVAAHHHSPRGRHAQGGSSEAGEKRCLVLLDAAKGCSTGPPDLSHFPADFVVLSYYKIFGYPTGVGALVVKREVL